MQQTTIECKYCGAPLDASAAVGSVIECAFCHRKHIVAKSTDGNAVRFLGMGEHDLDVCRFDDAYAAYQKAAEYDAHESEAYFGMALAEFKVQYIKDVVNGRLQAICHDVSGKAFTENKNYKAALLCATNEQREEYVRRAEEIDYIRGEFFKLKNSGLDYDCFICVKVTGANGERTPDYKIADDLYFQLRGKGYNPFFSEREIVNRTGVDYEAFILYALHSSECMLLVCCDESYLNTPWVKNEYTRFLELAADKQKDGDSITTVFDGAPIERIPGKLGKVQGINIRSVDALNRIIEYVDSHTPEAKRRKEQAKADKAAEEERLKRRLEEQAAMQAKQLEELKAQQEAARLELERKLAAVQSASSVDRGTIEMQQGGATARSLLVRAEQFLSAGDFGNAESYCNRVLDMDPENADAWFLLLLAALKIPDHANYINAVVKCIQKSTEIAEFKKRPAYVNASRYARGSADFVALENALDKLYNELRVKEEERAERERIEKERMERERIEKERFDIKGGVLIKYKKNESRVEIPDSVTSIGREAFQNCSGLTSITIPNSVTSIGESAFRGCSSIRSVTIPNGVTSIRKEAFQNCNELTSITIPNSVTSIGSSAFSGCSSIRSVTIPNGMTSIGAGAFSDCVYLTSITIPNSVTSIGAGAFSGCICLTSITISNSVTSIGAGAFSGCICLTSITIPNSVTSIGAGAFRDCRGLTSITIPNSVTSIGSSAFSGCCSLKSVTILNGVTSIGDGAFSGCVCLTSITIPDSVTNIENDVFRDCRGLTSVTIGNSVTSIGKSAFYDCSDLTSITIPGSVTSIGREAFSNCGSLTSIEIRDGVTSIGKEAFSNCSGLTSIDIPDSVTSIGDGAFSCCSGLTNVVIGNGVTNIENFAFGYCTAVRSITIPKSFKARIEEIFKNVEAVRGLFKKAKIRYI